MDSAAHFKKDSINKAFLFRILNKAKEKNVRKQERNLFHRETVQCVTIPGLFEHRMLRPG